MSQNFANTFISDTEKILGLIEKEHIEYVVSILRDTRERSGRLFLAGSGGGAGHASHATCDFRKLCGFEAYCVTDNVSELTARTNDEGWDTAYSNWLHASRLGPKDCLFIFSVGGGSIEPSVSINLVNAMRLAREVGASLVGIVGRDGGALKKLADGVILIPTVDPKFVTPQAEGLQALLWHLIVSHPSLAKFEAKWEGLTKHQSV